MTVEELKKYCEKQINLCSRLNDYKHLEEHQLVLNLIEENKQLKIQISAREEVCNRLESNWNKLKEWVNKHYDYYINNEDYIGGRLCFTDMKDKMQELEKSDSNENNNI